MPATTSETMQHIFAIIIGINEYMIGHQLSGAVADANDVYDLLIETFDADPTNIINIRDGEATRYNIIAKIQSLKDNPKIREGDAILIYFAGYGARVQSSNEEWDTLNPNNFFEAICPVDINTNTGYETISGIPDYLIGALLDELSQEKGNNITLILDSCQSNVVGRDGKKTDSDGGYGRQYLNPPPLTQNHDADITKFVARATQSPGFQGQNLDSHVAIVACSSHQVADEDVESDPSRGYFTRALTAVLREWAGASEMTYISLISRISAKIESQTEHKKNKPIQTPQLSGANACRLLFRDQVSRSDPSFFYGYKDTEQRFILRAGAILGVEKRLEFLIYGNNLSNKSNVLLGILVVKEVNDFESILTFPNGASSGGFELDVVFFAKPAFLPLKIYAEPNFREGIEHILSNLKHIQRSTVQWPESNNPKKADIKLEISGNDLVFHRCSELDQGIIDIIGTRIHHTVSITEYKKIFKIFQAIANYNRHLWDQGRDTGRSSIEFYEADVVSEGLMSGYVIRPIRRRENLLSSCGEMVEIVADDDKCYGVTINSPSYFRDLYPYLFVFYAEDFTIKPWSPYKPDHDHDTHEPGVEVEMNTRPPPKLKKRDKVRFGHGHGSSYIRGIPHKFTPLPLNSMKEVCFIKLYVSVLPIEINFIQQLLQNNPFLDGNRESVPFVSHQEFWGTRAIKVIRTSRPSSDSGLNLDLTSSGSKLCRFLNLNLFFCNSNK